MPTRRSHPRRLPSPTAPATSGPDGPARPAQPGVVLPVLVATVVGLAACGGGSTQEVATGPDATSPPTVASPSSAGGGGGTDEATPAPTPTTEPLVFADDLQPEDGDWDAPYGVDVAPDGTTWVLDAGNDRVLAFDADGNQVAEVGGAGDGPGEFSTLGFGALAVDADGAVYVVDNGNGRIQVLDPDGAVRSAWGSLGDGEGQFRRAIGIAVDDRGLVHVTDDERPEVQVFEPDGTFVRAYGQEGGGPGGLVHATGVDVDADGNAWVADYEARRVQVFAPAGEVVAVHEIPGPAGTTAVPEGVLALPDGRVWVTAYDGGEVVEVPRGVPGPDSGPDSGTASESTSGPAGEDWPVVAGGDAAGDGALAAPVDLAMAPDGTLVVTDQQAGTVQRFRAPE